MEPDPAVSRSTMRPARRWDWMLLAILVLAFGLRASLLRNGGPGFWGDESRYDVAVKVAHSLHDGKYGEGIEMILSKPDHMGFKATMIPLAWAQLKWGWSNGLVALLGSGFFSVLNIAWVYGLARRLGASLDEARWSALLMASTASMFYWSRHLVPYDLSLFWSLACLYVGVNPISRWYHSLIAGFCGFLAFVTYNGAWMLVAFALVAHVVRAWPSWVDVVLRALLGLVGLLGGIALLAYAAEFVELDLIQAYVAFAGTITQGDFADGWKVVVDYLWFADHGLVVVWLVAGAAFLWLVGVRREKEPGRVWLWFLGACTLGFGFVLLSNGLNKFVVYGRLARQLVPLLCLLGGWGVARLCDYWPRITTVGVVILVGLGAANLARPLAQVFPNDFYARGNVLIKHRIEHETDFAAQTKLREHFKYLYVGFIWPRPEHYDLPPYDVVMKAGHPLQYEPYLFEGFSREQRKAIHETDISMRLVQIKD